MTKDERRVVEEMIKEYNRKATSCHDLDYTYDKERTALKSMLGELDRIKGIGVEDIDKIVLPSQLVRFAYKGADQMKGYEPVDKAIKDLITALHKRLKG